MTNINNNNNNALKELIKNKLEQTPLTGDPKEENNSFYWIYITKKEAEDFIKD
jgi:hypothetical protein